METERFPKSRLYRDLTDILAEMTSDWDIDFSGEVSPETFIVRDLSFESIDVVQLIVALEERYGRNDMPFEELLMTEGRYVDDVRIGEAVDFLHRHLNAC